MNIVVTQGLTEKNGFSPTGKMICRLKREKRL